MKFNSNGPYFILASLLAAAVVSQIIFTIYKQRFGHGPGLNDQIDAVCTDIDVVRFVQKQQLRHARHEVFGSDQRIYESESRLFYDHSYGRTSVIAMDEQNHAVATLTYYRIWKNGNDNIRAHLDLFGKKCNASSTTSTALSRNRCSSMFDSSLKCVQSCRVTYEYSQDAGRVDSSSSSSRSSSAGTKYSFTFVRDPISRFISGYTEIEIRKGTPAVITGRVGTAERFKDFINLLLRSDGSKRVHEQYADMPHIAPQIGTMLSAHRIEKDGKSKLHLFKLEKFEEEWDRLTAESKFDGLATVYSAKQLVTHVSSEDPLNTTRSARSFLNLALRPVDGLMSARDMQQLRVAAKYMRAICRIYLLDFVCMGYDLPEPCADLTVELADILKSRLHPEHTSHRRTHVWGIVPISVLRFYAEIVCTFSLPQCVTDIVYGKNSGVDVD